MGGGLAQVGILAVLTVIVLPCCFFTLLALLDRFERSLATDETVRPAQASSPVAEHVIAADDVTASESVDADVVALPLSVSTSPIAPSVATG